MGRENISSTPKIEKDVIDYEKGISKLARNYNSFIENVLGTGLISKEDIVRIDAEIENDLRCKRWSGVYVHNSEEANELIHSDLILSENVDTNYEHKEVKGPKDWQWKKTSFLKGKINGKNSDLKKEIFSYKDSSRINDQYKYSGQIDKIELSFEECKSIFELHYEFQKYRMKKIQNLLEERQKEERSRKFLKKKQKIDNKFNEEFSEDNSV